MRRIRQFGALCLAAALLVTACGQKTQGNEGQEPQTDMTEQTNAAESQTDGQGSPGSGQETETPTEVNTEPEEFTITDKIPDKYIMSYSGEKGTVETITYPAKDYIGDGEGCEKKAYVYLPAGYDSGKKYNVMYLMHGIGGSENEWELNKDGSKLRKLLDNLIGRGEVEPFIVVTPNGRALGCQHTDATNAFYQFGYELRNDLIPYIESHYATYGEYSEDGYDLTAARRHRAMAGLSMGGMQTINIGLCECLDIISWFGAFSAAPTSYTAAKIAPIVDESEYEVDYLYNICGTDDGTAYASASAAAKTLDVICGKLTAGENFTWQERSGGHTFGIWHLGFYNFAHIAFHEAE